MRGFLVPSQGGVEKAIIHHKERGISNPTNIADVGSERYFYGSSQDTSIDDRITRMENSYATLVNELRESKGSTVSLVDEVSSLVAHLIVRTKRTRKVAVGGYEALGWMLDSLASDPRHVNKLLVEAVDPASRKLESAVVKAMSKRGIVLSQDQMAIFMEVVRSEIETNFDKCFSEAQDHASEMSEAFKREPEFDSKKAHLDLLSKHIEPHGRIEHLKQLRWVVESFESPLVLGDMPVVAFGMDGSRTDIMLSQARASTVVVPISSSHALVGRSGNSFSFNASAINRCSAGYSREFFISSAVVEESNELIQLLGTEPDLFSRDEVEELLEEKMSGHSEQG